MPSQGAYIPDGCIAKYVLGDGLQRDGTIIDRSGKGHNGTLYAPTLDFPGVNDYAKVNSPFDALTGKRYAVVVAKINPEAEVVARTLYMDAWNGDNTSDRLRVYIDTDDTLVVSIKAGATGDTARTSTSSSAVTEGAAAWQSLMVLVDLGTDGTVANGAAVSAWIDGAAFTMGALTGDLTQGTFAASVPSWQAWGSNATPAVGYTGQLRWVGVKGTDTAVTITDAAAYHANAQGWMDTNLADSVSGYWPLNEGTGSTCIDRSGNDRPLYTVGTVWITTAQCPDPGVNADTVMGTRCSTTGYIVVKTPTNWVNDRRAAEMAFLYSWIPHPSEDRTWQPLLCMNKSTNAGERMYLYNIGSNTTYRFWWEGTSALLIDFENLALGEQHFITTVINGSNAYGRGDGVTPALNGDAYGGNIDVHATQIGVNTYAHAVAAGDETIYGPHVILDLSSVTPAGADWDAFTTLLDTAWRNANMNMDDFCTNLSGILTGADTVDMLYWKLNEVPYGTEIDTDDIVIRYSRTVTVASTGTETADTAAGDGNCGDTENCTGYPLATLGDPFKGGKLYMDTSYDLNVADHADFSFNGTADQPFSFVIWSDANLKTSAQNLLLKTDEYSFVIDTAGKLVVTLTDGEGDTILTTADAANADGTLHCWAFVYTGSTVNTGLSIYEDGAVVASTDGGAGVYGNMSGTANAVLIDGMFQANVYNAQIYNRELSAAEIKALYNQGAYR